MDLEQYARDLLKKYESTSAAEKIALGFSVGNDVYLIHLSRLRDDMIKMDIDSKTKDQKLRLRITTKTKKILMNQGAIKIGSIDEILSGRINKGEAFEKWYTEHHSQTWKKDSTAYYKDGDITVNGIRIQIKWENASLTTVKVIKDGIQYKEMGG